jgi:hypothetical protein
VLVPVQGAQVIDGLLDPGQPLRHRQLRLLEHLDRLGGGFWPAGADAELEAAAAQQRQRVRIPGREPRRPQRGGQHPGPDPQRRGRSRRHRERGHRGRQLQTVGHQQR